MLKPDIDLQKSVEPIIRKAGDILLSYWQKPIIRSQKKDHGFVTEADIASEEYLIEALHQVLPEASFFAEESGKKGNTADGYCWVIDPLDGTTNFAFGIPHFCISIALTYFNEPIFGMIFLPLFDELFYAQKGKGSFLNQKKIAIAQDRPLDKTLLLVGFPYKKGKTFLRVLENLNQISTRTYAFRHLGAIAIDQAYIACGRADGLFFEDLAWWDVAAGILLIKEAGGVVSTYEGKDIRPEYHSYVAANEGLYQHLFSLLQK
ncbi:MAG: inositol monophosphatase family protein [Candidatus Babeliales bacterium]